MANHPIEEAKALTDSTRLRTRPEAAEYLSISIPYLDKLVHDKKITVRRIGSSVRFTLEDLEEFIAGAAVKAKR